MKFAHSCDNRLARLLIGMRTERRVLLRQFRKGLAHLALSRLGLRLNGKFNNRFREFHGFQDNRMLFITDSITGCSKFKTNRSGNVTGINFIQLRTLIGMHLQDTSHTLFLILCCVQHIGT